MQQAAYNGNTIFKAIKWRNVRNVKNNCTDVFFFILYLVLKLFLTVLHHRLCAAKLHRDTIALVVKLLWHYSSCYNSHSNSKWLKKKTIFVHLLAELIGMAVTLTGDELQFHCLSASTHPTGYAWEEKAGQVSNVMSRAKNVETSSNHSSSTSTPTGLRQVRRLHPFDHK